MAVRLPQPLRPLWPWFKAAYTQSTHAAAPLTQQLSRLRGGWLPRRAVSLVDQLDGQSARVWIAKPEEDLSRAVPAGEPGRHRTFVRELREVVPRAAVAELPNGRVLGPHRAVIDSTGTMIDEFSPYWGTTSWRQHPIFWHPFVSPPAEIAGTLGVLAARGDHSYYHFLLDVVPRLKVLETSGVPAPDNWYVPLQHTFQREILELAGFMTATKKIIDSDLVPHVQAEALLVPGLPDAELRTPPWAVAFIRDRLRTKGLERVPGRRIYVTRGAESNNRIVTNEADILEVLADRGFAAVDPGRMSVKQQIKTFAEAECIVAPHGAALANVAFASSGASVLELFAPDFVQGCYWKLAATIPGLEYRYLVGLGKPPRNGKMHGVMSDITVDPRALARSLDTQTARPGPAAESVQR